MNHGRRPFPALLLLLSLCAAWLSAQETGPQLLCTRSEAGGEILTWINQPSSCGEGTYLGTEVYRSTSQEGPYEVIASLRDSTITEYRDENPTGERLYYYVAYVTVCGDGDREVSDTLDSFVPETPLLRFVSVEDSDLVLGWEASASPEVTGYVILEVTPSGIVAIDTVGDVRTYRITGVPTDELTTRQYRIAAIDPCGNDSPQSRIASAIELSGVGGIGCNSDITLVPVVTEFSAIAGDPGGQPELFVSIDGGMFQQTDYAVDSSNLNALIYQDGRDGEEVCFYVQQRLTTGESVRTNTFCRSLSITPRLPSIELYGLEYDDAGRMVIKYFAGEEFGALITEATLQYGGVNIPTLRLSIPFDDFTRDSLIVAESIEQRPGGVVLLEFFDACDRQSLTNPAGGTFLFAGTAGGQTELNWVPAGNDDTTALRTYTILRQNVDGSFEVIADNLSDLNYTDTSTGSGCYRVITSFTPSDRDTTLTFRSNIACVAEEARVYVPNTFSPTATQDVNRNFRPLFSDPSAARDYRLRIFGRWGALYFESADPLDAWDGTLGGKQAPVGAYIYTLTYQGPTGNLIERSGVVTLLR